MELKKVKNNQNHETYGYFRDKKPEVKKTKKGNKDNLNYKKMKRRKTVEQSGYL